MKVQSDIKHLFPRTRVIILSTFPKGGIGKTILAVRVTGLLLSVTKERILLIDADPRSDSWRFYLGRKPNLGL